MIFIDNETKEKVSLTIHEAVKHIINKNYNFNSISFVECETLDETKALLKMVNFIPTDIPTIIVKDKNSNSINYFSLMYSTDNKALVETIVDVFGCLYEPVFYERVFSDCAFKILMENKAPLVILDIVPTEENKNQYYYSIKMMNIKDETTKEIKAQTAHIPILNGLEPIKRKIKLAWETYIP